MGCILDTGRPRPRTQVQNMKSPMDSTKQEPVVNAINDETLRNDYTTILQGLQMLPKPDKTGPVVCTSDLSIPLVIAPLSLEEGDSTGVTLPVLGIARYGKGRVTVIGSETILLQCTKEDTDASAFLENLIKWNSGVSRGRVAMQICGFDQGFTDALAKNVSGFGFKVQVNPEPEFYLKTHVIVIPSNYNDIDNKLVDFVNSGGGIIAALTNPQNPPDPFRFRINNVLEVCGVGFPNTNLLVGPVNSQALKISQHISSMTKYNFNGITDRIQETLKNDQFDLKDLDALITAARYNIMCMPQSTNSTLLKLQTISTDFLEKTNYSTAEGYCPDLVHCVVTVLLCEIQSKLAAESFDGVDRSEVFPGKVSTDFDLDESHSVSIKVGREGWFTTGYWLPAGIVAKVKVTSEFEGSFSFQVGSHTEVLLSKPGPWKRWPMVTTSFEMKAETDVASPFGGIVYLVAMSPECVGQTVELTIDHVTPYPISNIAEPEVWERTKDLPVPWAEVHTRRLIFTLPVTEAKSVVEATATLKQLDSLVDHITRFCGEHNDRVFRVVFDIELCEADPVCGYPIVMPMEAIETFFGTEPSEDIFIFLTYIGVLSMPEGAFDDEREASIAHVAACAAFMSAWPGVSPLDYSHLMLPALFNELWNIYKKDAGSSLTCAMQNVRDVLRNEDGIGDGWKVLINEIQMISGLNLEHLTPAKDKNEDRGVVMSMSSASLQSYQLNDDF